MFKGETAQVWVRNRAGLHELKEMRWGMIPSAYAAAPELFNGATTHARLETVAEKPYFADCWRRKWRCLFMVANFKQMVSAEHDLFGGGKGKQSVIVTRADGLPLGIAGIYNAIKAPTELILSAAMLTRDPGPAMAKLHDREPVVIEPRDFATWLDGSDDLDLTSPWRDDVFTYRAEA